MNKKTARNSQKKQQALKALQDGNSAKAKKLLLDISRHSPKDAQTWFLLSNIYGREGQFEDVLRACAHALQSGLQDDKVYANLGHAYAALHKLEEAISAFGKAAEYAPLDPVCVNNLATVLHLAGHGDEALKKFEQAVALEPDYAKAHLGLARALESRQQQNKAIQHYQTAIKLNPQLLEAHLHLGDLLSVQGFLEQADFVLQHAITLHPAASKLYYRLAKNLQYQGKFHKAIETSQQGLQLNPDDPEGLACAAEIYERQGEYQKAVNLVRKLMTFEKMTPPAADVYLKLCRKFDCCDEAISIAAKLIANHTIDDSVKAQLHYSLGNVYDKQSKFDLAFENYARANELSRLHYDADGQKEKTDRLIAAFSVESMRSIARSDNTSGRPVFIIGMPRSGTTLVEQILAAHPDVFGGGELAYINELIRPLPPSLYPDDIASIQTAHLNHLATTYLQRLNGLNQDTLRITDKMPGNFRNLGLIALMLPKARVIHCRRNPLDTCLSIFFQNFNLAHTYATTLEDIGAYYREYARLMAHWQTVLDIPILQLSYADLINEQETWSRKMIEFCGLDWDNACLRFHQTDRKVATASYDQVRKPVYRSSLDRWKNYEKYLGPLKKALEGLTSEE